MVAFDRNTDLPSNINTVEELLVWSSSVLEILYRSTTYKEADGDGINSGLAPLIATSLITASDDTKRFIVRGAVQLDDAYATGAAKLWEYAVPFGNALTPAAFKTN